MISPAKKLGTNNLSSHPSSPPSPPHIPLSVLPNKDDCFTPHCKPSWSHISSPASQPVSPSTPPGSPNGRKPRKHAVLFDQPQNAHRPQARRQERIDRHGKNGRADLGGSTSVPGQDCLAPGSAAKSGRSLAPSVSGRRYHQCSTHAATQYYCVRSSVLPCRTWAGEAFGAVLEGRGLLDDRHAGGRGVRRGTCKRAHAPYLRPEEGRSWACRKGTNISRSYINCSLVSRYALVTYIASPLVLARGTRWRY